MPAHMQIGNNPEYVRRVATPAAVGIVLGCLVLLSYLLFFLVSACCKCCSKKRGCCQRAQPTPYCARLPYVIIVAICAVIGLVGGAIVLEGAPSFATATRTLVPSATWPSGSSAKLPRALPKPHAPQKISWKHHCIVCVHHSGERCA